MGEDPHERHAKVCPYALLERGEQVHGQIDSSEEVSPVLSRSANFPLKSLKIIFHTFETLSSIAS